MIGLIAPYLDFYLKIKVDDKSEISSAEQSSTWGDWRKGSSFPLSQLSFITVW